MKCIIPEISWHNREPVLSIHLQPVSEKNYRLATGGADCHVLIWQLIVNDNGAVKNEALSDLTRHQRAVNSVRWSPNGQYLATADDDANIIIWQLKTDNIPLLEGETSDKETWLVYKIMRGHKEDIYDLCWSPNGLKLLSGSIDNSAIIWDFTKGKSEHILKDHKGFVQGVAWDPKGVFLATISTDRICRIYESSGKIKHRIQKGYLPVPQDHYLYNKDVKYFHDDTFKSFFRRLDFSPDGTLLAVPSGRIEIEDCKKILNATLIFAVESLAAPVALLPSGRQCSTVVRFCPILFEMHEDGPDPIITLPFRMIIAIGTDHDVILYDTQQMAPFAYFKDIHYTRLTDLTWSSDGLLLVASSTDGYCAIITFEPNELGVQYVKEESEVEESTLDVSGCELLEKEENVEFVKPKKLNLLEKWTVKTPKKNKNEISTPSTSNSVIIIDDDDDNNKRKREDELNKSAVAPKRIKPISIQDKTATESAKIKDSVPSNSQVVKRIRPIPVNEKMTDQKTDNSDVKIKDSSPKVNPLLNFLRKTPKQKSDECNKTKTVTPSVEPMEIIVLDEIEARDAWKCEKDETNKSQIEVHDLEEYTEDFSLHLEDSKNETVNTENCVLQNKADSSDNVEAKADSKLEKQEATKSIPGSSDATKIRKIEETVTSEPLQNNEDKQVTDETVTICCPEPEKCANKTVVNALEKIDDAENCVQNKDKNIDSTQEKSKLPIKSETEQDKTQTVDKTTIPKRRVPLITLSSPKHKKK